MGWSFVQSSALGADNNGTQVTCNFPAVSQLGNWVLFFQWGTSPDHTTVDSITDNGATPNIYTRLDAEINNIQSPDIYCSIWIAQILSLPNGLGTLLNTTFTDGGVARAIMACMAEFNGGGRGSSVVDAKAVNNSSTGQPNTGAMTTGSLDALAVAVCVSNDPSNPGTITVPAGFTSIASELVGKTYRMGNACWKITSGLNVTTNPVWHFGNPFGQAFSAIQLSLALAPLRPPANSRGIANAEGLGA